MHAIFVKSKRDNRKIQNEMKQQLKQCIVIIWLRVWTWNLLSFLFFFIPRKSSYVTLLITNVNSVLYFSHVFSGLVIIFFLKSCYEIKCQLHDEM